ncbi:hypothetical protein CYLTODRAFT_451207 [Cylindrobasidium torrendii FP15055 ss-10]|uniref:Protein byr4 n=1 Tax=Cylindrobasidium torrendii FP15055 ss-10 TaxID=1314674 RepID=A0A0D7BK96_9AGAR|nr:hypothetical protein CYLTODRAFT_451207 [Cylindrobasidium torrendii FP15055 ss-10]
MPRVQEEWTDADFDLPESLALPTPSVRDDEEEEDWDMDMDLGPTGGAKAFASSASSMVSSSEPGLHIIRPRSSTSISSMDEDEDEEGLSTIKVTLRPRPAATPTQEPIEEDFEDGLALPSELTQLSLAPLTLSHRASKMSFDWEDKDTTSSSQSSDAYSSLGFADASPSSNSSNSVLGPDTEDEFEDDLDGLVIPSSVFDAGFGKNQLARVLAQRKAAADADAITSPKRVADDDFEMDLIIDDDDALSPTQLKKRMQVQPVRQLRRVASRSTSSVVPPRLPSMRPPSRVKSERAASPNVPPPQSSARQLQKLRISPTPPVRPPSASSFQAFPSPSSASSGFLSPKPGSLRSQKSHMGLQPRSDSGGSRKLSRKASESSLPLVSPASSTSSGGPSRPRHEQPTAASLAKSKASSTRLSAEYQALSVRPTTPTSTMPKYNKIRPSLSSVFSAPKTSTAPFPRTSSPLPPPPPRPPSGLSKMSKPVPPTHSPPPVPDMLRRPKKARTYGDGTELDMFDDLPTDQVTEKRFRVEPKGYGNRVPGGTYGTKERKLDRREPSGGLTAAPAASLRRASKMSLNAYKTPPPSASPQKKKKKVATSPNSKPKAPFLITQPGTSGPRVPKVVGGMKWNPSSLRWEGNDDALKEFDAVVTSTRPALITQHTGSSESPLMANARRVGNMIFDPSRMCWISALPPEEEEPDVFADMADDEDDSWHAKKGGTIRATAVPLPASAQSSIRSNMSVESIEELRNHTRTPSDCGSDDRGSRASFVWNVDDGFVDRCRAAETRHRHEMRAWRSALVAPRRDQHATQLYEIRSLATRKY